MLNNMELMRREKSFIQLINITNFKNKKQGHTKSLQVVKVQSDHILSILYNT